LKYSFYALKSIELLRTFLNLGGTTLLQFDRVELLSFISRNIIETAQKIYYLPKISQTPELILENTYYMIYILKLIDAFTFNAIKFENLVKQFIDYSNIKNIYYCYKILEILELDIAFNQSLLQSLVHDIFSAEYYEYYLTPGCNKIDQDIFLWICEMSQENQLQINVQYIDNIELGTNTTINVNLHLLNLIMGEVDLNFNATVTFESGTVGVHTFREMNHPHHFNLIVPIPLKSSNYPLVQGRVMVYKGNISQEIPIVMGQLSISIHTFYPETFYKSKETNAYLISICFLIFPGGVIIFAGIKSKKNKIED